MPQSSRKRRPDARPGEIIKAALDLFSERGFSATRLEDVAARAGLSKAAIYLYFDDKTALLKAVVRETVGASIERARTEAERGSGPVAPQLRLLLAGIATTMSNSRLPDVIKLVVSESRAHPEIGRFYLDNVICRVAPMVEAMIARGIASGEFRAVDAGLAVRSLVGPMVLAALWRSVFEPLGAEPLAIDALAAQHADLIIAGLSAKA
jgi:AcrR family transcriptional regulator